MTDVAFEVLECLTPRARLPLGKNDVGEGQEQAASRSDLTAYHLDRARRVLAGALPLIPYTIPDLPADRFGSSVAVTLLALFSVGALRSLIANVRWWIGGAEMLALGGIVAAIAYASGAAVASLVGG